MNPRTPDQPDHDQDDDLVFPATTQQPPQFGDRPDGPGGGHPDVIWHRPGRRRLRDAVPADLQHLPDPLLVLGALAVLAAIVLLAFGLAEAAFAAWHWTADPEHLARPAARIWHTLDNPILHSLDRRAAGLPADARTLHTAWAAAGTLILIVALRRGASVGVQLGALVFGVLTVAMVWDGTAGPGRPVAAGLAALIWAVLSALALTGSWITTRTTVFTTVEAAPAAGPVPVTVQVTVPEPRIEAVVVDVQHLVVDRDGRRVNPGEPEPS